MPTIFPSKTSEKHLQQLTLPTTRGKAEQKLCKEAVFLLRITAWRASFFKVYTANTARARRALFKIV